ncbi:MAG: hypothetical protein QXS54_06590, partial [Candidatus Methanomethylicaceae archaeon]
MSLSPSAALLQRFEVEPFYLRSANNPWQLQNVPYFVPGLSPECVREFTRAKLGRPNIFKELKQPSSLLERTNTGYQYRFIPAPCNLGTFRRSTCTLVKCAKANLSFHNLIAISFQVFYEVPGIDNQV